MSPIKIWATNAAVFALPGGIHGRVFVHLHATPYDPVYSVQVGVGLPLTPMPSSCRSLRWFWLHPSLRLEYRCKLFGERLWAGWGKTYDDMDTGEAFGVRSIVGSPDWVYPQVQHEVGNLQRLLRDREKRQRSEGERYFRTARLWGKEP